MYDAAIAKLSAQSSQMNGNEHQKFKEAILVLYHDQNKNSTDESAGSVDSSYSLQWQVEFTECFPIVSSEASFPALSIQG